MERDLECLIRRIRWHRDSKAVSGTERKETMIFRKPITYEEDWARSAAERILKAVQL
jgi:hypothetical protein